MIPLKFIKNSSNLLEIYEYNYYYFRLVVPNFPKNNHWHVLKSENNRDIYIKLYASHKYTSEWFLGHYFPHKKRQKFAPNFLIRLYHDARLCEAKIKKESKVIESKKNKLIMNKSLAEWLEYCYRNQYSLKGETVDIELPDIQSMLVE